MRILIINPPGFNTVVENPDEDGKGFVEVEDFGAFPPLGALYVLSYLEAKTTGHDLFFKDCIGERMSYPALEDYIRQVKPDIVGITSFTISLVDVIKTARLIREIVPHKVHICLGGHHAIAYPQEAAKLKDFDSIVVGEGEIAFTDLVTALEQGDDFTKIVGVYTEDSIKKHLTTPFRDRRFLQTITVPPAYIEDINALPVLNRKYIRHISYHNVLGATADFATLLRSRGCPYKCTFCDVPFKAYRPRSTKLVVDEIEQCIELGYKEFRFYDDLFNKTPGEVIELCDEIDKRGLKILWDFRGRVNTLTRESMVRAKKSGLRAASFGVETGTDAGLKMLKKGTNTAKIRETFKLCRELGITSLADFIIGFPHEKTVADVKENINFLLELDPDYALINVLMLYPNTEIYNSAISEGVIEPGRWEEYALNPSKDFKIDHWEEHLDLATQINLQKWAYRKFYFRPSYILRSVLKTRSLYEFKSKVKGVLSMLIH